jgi:hypothetical protein
MSEAAPATQEAAPGPIDYQPPALSQEALSLDDAVRMLSEPPKKPEEEQAEAPAKAAEQEESAKADADPEKAPGEQAQADEQEAELPPIDPPRSWTQAEKERFQSLPRETQEYLSHREQERETALRRSQNEIAEQRKAIEVERQKAEQVKQQYEAQLPALMRELESVNQAQFSDIKSMEDVVKLQAEDPFRFQAWQVHQMRMQAVKQEADRAEQEKQAAEQSNWARHVQEENARAVEFIPELADKTKGEALTKRVASELLPELGFKDSELAELATGKSKLSIYDHRVQRLLADALKLRDIQKAKVAAVSKPVPPVQKPGVAAPRGAAQAQSIQALNQKLSASGSVDDALALLMAQRKAS